MSRTLVIEKEVFTFAELSESAKERARDWYRDGMEFDSEFVLESSQTAAGILGIEGMDISYSGFCSQGDGASFTGSYSFTPNAPAKMREEFPQDEKLHAMADELQALQIGQRLACGSAIYATIRRSGSYSHEYSMQIDEIQDSENGEGIEELETEEKLLELFRSFARWIYASLEAEWDYRNSDEAIDEDIEANDYEFDEDGGII